MFVAGDGATARQGAGGRASRRRHPARRRHLSGERLVRSLLRDVPARGESARRARVHAAARHAGGGRPLAATLLTANPNFPQSGQRRRCRQSVSAEPVAGGDGRSGSQLHAGADRVQPRQDGFVSGDVGQNVAPDGSPAPQADKIAEPGVLRRQHGDGALELRAALRDERSLLSDDVRAVGARGAQPGVGPDERRDARQERREPERAHRRRRRIVHGDRRRRSHRRHLLVVEAHSGHDGRTQHRRSAQCGERLVGLVRGGLRREGGESRTGRPAARDRTRRRSPA